MQVLLLNKKKSRLILAMLPYNYSSLYALFQVDLAFDIYFIVKTNTWIPKLRINKLFIYIMIKCVKTILCFRNTYAP